MSHNLKTGDMVRYYVAPGGTPIAGLTPGGLYRVFRVDDTRLKLIDPAAPATIPATAPGSLVTGDTIVAFNNFYDGAPVTYTPLGPVQRFSSRTVDAELFFGTCSGDGPDTCILISANNNEIVLPGHGFVTGEAVKYTVNVGGIRIGGLNNGDDVYYVVRLDDDRIKLAASYCNAVGDDGTGPCALPDDGDADSDPEPRPVVTLSLVPDKSTAGIGARHALQSLEDFPLSGLTPGQVYFVRDASPFSFRLAATPGGAAITDINPAGSAHVSGGPHLFEVQGINLTSHGSGEQHVVLDIAPSSGTQQLILNPAENYIGAPSFDRTVTASSAGGGGGFINVQGSDAAAAASPEVNLVIQNATIIGWDVVAATNNLGWAKALSTNGGGGFISVGDADAFADVRVNTKLSVWNGANITGVHDVVLSSRAETFGETMAETDAGGLGAGVDSFTRTNLDFTSIVEIDGNVTAGNTAYLHARSWTDGRSRSIAEGSGLGADAEANDTGDSGVQIGVSVYNGEAAEAYTQVDLLGNATVVAANVDGAAIVEALITRSVADSEANAAGGDSHGRANSNAWMYTEFRLQNGAYLRGDASVNLYARHDYTDVESWADADCDCGGGHSAATADNNLQSEVQVTGRAGAVVVTSNLNVEATYDDDIRWHRRSDGGGGLTVDNDDNYGGAYNPRREIFFGATVILFGEANPWLEVDQNGFITKIVNVTVSDENGTFYSLGQQITGNRIVVHDLIYDQGAEARFFSDDPRDQEGQNSPDGHLFGNSALFEIPQTWEYVRLFNRSAKILETNIIDVTLNFAPGEEMKVTMVADIVHDDNPGNGGSPGAFPTDLGEGSTPNTTFDFQIDPTFPPTQVEVINYISAALGIREIVLNGYIENPIGRTHVENQRGDVIVGADGDVELLRTNVLELAATGSVGQQGPRRPLVVHLIRYRSRDDVVHEIQVRADAGGDLVLDLTHVDRADEFLGSATTVVIERLRAGDDVDVVISDSLEGNDLIDLAKLHALEFVPDTSDNLSAPSDDDSGFYARQFEPDGDFAADLARILRAFGSINTALDSAYVFSEVRSGDDLDICHVTTTGSEGKVCPSAQATTITFTINTDVDWSGGTPPDSTPLIFLTTNGFINATETAGDMLVGHIHSTGDDVNLLADWRILDGDGVASIDVTGEDVTMTAGNGGFIGGVGLATDFLEINSDRNNDGSDLAVHDITGPFTDGIFLDELTGDMRIDVIRTPGDVSLRTSPNSGSIIDALDDDAADVIGQSIDIDANGVGASIGDPNGGNDLDIDSSCTVFACGTGDVSLEATDHIYVTETDGTLRLVLAHAIGGDIRLTVRESAPDTDEDLHLLASGSARFAESEARSAGDAPRNVTSGNITALNGFVLLLVGDDVDTHQNSSITAGDTIDIYGDHLNLDPTFGTNMTLSGSITSGAGDLTQIWGHTDVDTFELGSSSGEYIYLGGKTRIRGSQNLSALDEDDGEDRFRVYYLQTMNTGAGHTLTLDGQGESDYYEVFTTGSQGAVRDYIVNVLDTGAPDDGADELYIYGFDSPLNGTVPGTIPPEKYPADDIFLLRRSQCIDTDGASDCANPSEIADRPASVNLLHGALEPYRDIVAGNEPTTALQRVNYDTALNGRLMVFGLGGNDYFATDDNSAITTLDGGAGDDTFQIGQIFGFKRDVVEGNLLPEDVFPELVATTRGWLSPGITQPLVAQGGTGNDEFVVFSNQAELRLEGDDGNDLFVVRAFALAVVVDTDANGDGVLDHFDVDLVADPITGLYPQDLDNNGQCSASDGYSSFRLDNNGDGICNNADAHMTTDPDEWEDDEIIFDDRDGVLVARPIIGLGFAVDHPIDVRAGGGDDEVQYNVNAPVSIDGGNGVDKLVVLATEFADDIVITANKIYGVGLNVRYASVEIVEVDGLEGDDEFFVQSTEFGVAYRIIGGLGSDTINVAGDVVEDIVTRELEGISGTVDHQVTSPDAAYDGMAIGGIDLNVATGDEGNVVITETGNFTGVREGGPMFFDNYFVRLAAAPTAPVYVTISASRSAQEEAAGIGGPAGDTIWLCTGTSAADCDSQDDFERHIFVNGVPTDVARRAMTFTFLFTPENWDIDQSVYVFAYDDLRPEGDRIVTVNHSVISLDSRYNATDVRNVEVRVRDNDTPGVNITEVEPGTSTQDDRTITIEGSSVTEYIDEVHITLEKPPLIGSVVIQLSLDDESDAQISLLNLAGDSRFDLAAKTITFNTLNWADPVRVGISSRNDPRREDPGTAVIVFEKLSSDDPTYVFGPELLDVETIDDDTPGAVLLESGLSTLVVRGGATDDYTLRLTQRPTDNVEIAILTDGLTDVVSINGLPFLTSDYRDIGGYVPTRSFAGGLIVSGATIMRGTGSELGSFLEEGFTPGSFIRVNVGATTADVLIANTPGAVTHDTITLDAAFAVSGNFTDASISRLIRQGQYTGNITFDAATNRLTRSDCLPSHSCAGWLADGFLEGQRIRIDSGPNAGIYKIALIRGFNTTKDETLELTLENALASSGSGDVTITRVAAVVTFTPDDWYIAQRIELGADVNYDVPITRQGAKYFPASTHLLSKLRGPLSVEGGTTEADRSLKNGLKLPGEADAELFEIGEQPPESQQIDVLNIFNDSSRADTTGTLSSTRLTGFGMAKDLSFGLSHGVFGEPAIFPGGINFGALSFVDGQFVTDDQESSIEVVNLMLGQGNDRLTITGHARPARGARHAGHGHAGVRLRADGHGRHDHAPRRRVLRGFRLPRRPAREHRRPVRRLAPDRDRRLRLRRGHRPRAAGRPAARRSGDAGERLRPGPAWRPDDRPRRRQLLPDAHAAARHRLRRRERHRNADPPRRPRVDRRRLRDRPADPDLGRDRHPHDHRLRRRGLLLPGPVRHLR